MDSMMQKNTPSNLIVYNDSKNEKMFHFFNIVEGRGTGTPIRPNDFQEFNLEKGAYDWYYYNRTEDSDNIDTLKKGKTIYRYPKWRKIIVMN